MHKIDIDAYDNIQWVKPLIIKNVHKQRKYFTFIQDIVILRYPLSFRDERNN